MNYFMFVFFICDIIHTFLDPLPPRLHQINKRLSSTVLNYKFVIVSGTERQPLKRIRPAVDTPLKSKPDTKSMSTMTTQCASTAMHGNYTVTRRRDKALLQAKLIVGWCQLMDEVAVRLRMPHLTLCPTFQTTGAAPASAALLAPPVGPLMLRFCVGVCSALFKPPERGLPRGVMSPSSPRLRTLPLGWRTFSWLPSVQSVGAG